MNPKIVPTVLFETIEEYKKYIEVCSKFSQLVHLDICDGQYVTSKTPTLDEVLKLVTRFSNIDFNIHLMVENPIEQIKNSELPSNIKTIYIHIEKVNEKNLLDLESNFADTSFAVVIRPDTSSGFLLKQKKVLSKVKSILLLSVIPGFMGGEFIPEVYKKTSLLHEFGFTGKYHFDGHMDKETIPQVLKYGPEIINIGSVLAKSIDPEETYNQILSII